MGPIADKLVASVIDEAPLGLEEMGGAVFSPCGQ
jgi:hypothetical protein